MKTCKFLLTVILLSLAISSFAKENQQLTTDETTIFVDFGGWMDTSLDNWNAFQTFGTTPTVVTLIDSLKNTTAFTLTLTQRFKAVNWNGGGNPTFTNWTIPHYSAVYDSFYGTRVDEGESILVISGLSSNHKTTLSFFSSAFATSYDPGPQTPTDNNRETAFIVKGATEKSDSVNASNNLTTLVQFNDVLPDASGYITITVRAGANNTHSTGAYFLNAMRLIIKDETTTGNEENSMPAESVYCSDKKLTVTGNEIERIVLFNLDGKQIRTFNDAGTYDLSDIASGLYFVNITDAKGHNKTYKILN